jgi:hypothetical protein
MTTAGSFRKAFDHFHLTRSRVTNLAAAERLWERCLKPNERRSLGETFPEAVENHGDAVRIWMHVHGVSYQRAVIEVGETLGFLNAADVDWLLREGGEIPRDLDEAQSQAIARGDLVIERSSQSVYWHGQRINADWTRHRASWDFLLLACEHAMRNHPIDRLSFAGDAHEDVVTKSKSRLKGVQGFPDELINLFVVVGRGTQKLSMPSDQIHIF